MSVRTYTTDEICPNCNSNIWEALVNHVFSEGGRDFETECPNCNTMLEIEVQPVPAFTIAKVAVEQSVQSDGLQVSAPGGSVTNDANAAWEAIHVSRRR
jgi:hypothetical protein